jgi:DNA primase
MAFPDSFVDEVRRTADIVRFISDQVSLKKAGVSWKGLCPFHQEKTPSFNVRSEPPLFHCFGCGEGGDVFKFVMLRERASFPEAVEIVARRFGIAVPENRYEVGPDRKEREEILALMEAAAEHFARTLWTAPGTRARDYLLGRGFKKETLERIRAGAAPDAWSSLFEALRRKFPEAVLQTAGLVIAKQETKSHYDRFRNRAIFPILNESGKVVAFGARSLDGSEPKYLNSPETPVYQKSRVLYGLSWARDPIRQQGHAVLMEGYLDVARALEAGVGEAVATCGTAMTSAHARLLHRFTEKVVVNFDQDEAGQKAARKSLDILVAEGLAVHVVELPEGEDPDTYLKAFGAEAYRQRLAEAPPYMEWLIRRAAAQHDTRTPAGKAAYIEALLPSLVAIESAVERAAWLPTVAERGGLDEAAARDELRRAMSGRPPSPAPSAPPGPLASARSAASLQRAEKWLLALIVREAEGIHEALSELSEADLAGLGSGELLRAAKTLISRDERVTPSSLDAEIKSEESKRFLTEIAVEETPTGDATPMRCVLEIKCWPLEARISEIQRQLPKAEDENLNVLFREQLSLKQQIADLSRSIAASD